MSVYHIGAGGCCESAGFQMEDQKFDFLPYVEMLVGKMLNSISKNGSGVLCVKALDKLPNW